MHFRLISKMHSKCKKLLRNWIERWNNFGHTVLQKLHFQLFVYIFSCLFTFSAVFLHFQLFLYIYSCLFTFSADCWVFQLFIYIFSWLFTFFSYRQHMLCCWLCLPRRIWILPTPEWLFEILCLRFRWTASRIMQWRINV